MNRGDRNDRQQNIKKDLSNSLRKFPEIEGTFYNKQDKTQTRF